MTNLQSMDDLMNTRGWIPVTLAVLILSAPLVSCNLHGRPKVERQERDRPVAASVVARGEEAAASWGQTTEADGSQVVAPGIVEPWGGQVELAAREPGWIARIAVKEGDDVRAGQLMASLDEEAQRHAIELARAELAEAQARAGFARAAAARINRLHAQGTIPDNEADRANANAEAESAAAERAAARLRLAQANLERRRVVAPQSGTVLLSRFHPGEFYQPGTEALFVLGDMTRLQVRLEVDEIDASAVPVGARCQLYSDGGSPLVQGTVVRVAPKMGRRGLPLESPTARADVRVREVFVEIPTTAALVPGQRVWGHVPRLNSKTQT